MHPCRRDLDPEGARGLPVQEGQQRLVVGAGGRWGGGEVDLCPNWVSRADWVLLGAGAAVLWVIGLCGTVAAAELLRPIGAIGLVAFGVFKLVKPRSHPRWVGLRVSLRDLVVWSFLMSSAHGAGLMLVPVLLGMSVPRDAPDIPGLSLGSLAQDLAAADVVLAPLNDPPFDQIAPAAQDFCQLPLHPDSLRQ